MGGKTINIACIIEGDIYSGGGFQAQLSSAIEISKITKIHREYNFFFFVFTRANESILKKYGLNVEYINQNLIDRMTRVFLRNNSLFRFTKKYHLKTTFEKILERFRIDLVYFLYPSFLALDLVCHNYIFTVWDLCHRDFPEFPEVNFYREFELREELYNNTLKKAVAVITDSKLGKQNIVKRYGIDENRIYVANFTPSLNIKETSFVNIKSKYNINTEYIFYPAQFWAHKNHIYIIDAISILKAQGTYITALFSGSDRGNLDYVLNYAKRKGVLDLVKYISFAPNEEIYHLYKQSLCLVMPTYFGPTNIPPLEAFAIGTPVIYSGLQGLKDQVVDAALLCDLKDPNSLANCIKILLSDKNKREELIQEGYKRLHELQKNSIGNVILKILEDYSVKLKCWRL